MSSIFPAMRFASAISIFIALMLFAPLGAEAQAADQTRDEARDGRAEEGAEEGFAPPQLLESPPAVYPAGREDEDLHPTIVLLITIDADGELSEIEVEHGFDDDFDQAAIDAVRRWKFAPARHGDQAIASRVHIAVHFELPHFDLHGPRGAIRSKEGGEESEPAQVPSLILEQPAFSASGERERERLRAEDRGAADLTIEGEALRRTPAQDSGSLLMRAPGLFVSRAEGEAVADSLMLRGFDADHGQDIELTLQGLPINQPSHIHGQGYADLNFIIPEVVHRLRVIEGVYDPRQGDFAVAGSANFELGVERRGIHFETRAGSFRSFRQLAIVAPKGADAGSFAAADFRRTRGFGQNREGQSARVMGQWVLSSGSKETRLLGSFHAGRADLAGVLRLEDIERGERGYYDVYPLATTRAQSATTMRAELAIFHDVRLEKGANASVSAALRYQRFGIFQNYTGFTQRSFEDPSWVGRGDLIDQSQDHLGLVFQARYRAQRFSLGDWLSGHAEIGMQGRADRIDQKQSLIEAPQMRVWDHRRDATISALNVGIYADLDLRFGERFSLRGGVRADLLGYDVEDRLAHRIPYGRPERHLEGARTTALGAAIGPRIAAEIKAHERLRFIAAYGEGFRSPDAMLLGEGERAPFTKVRSADLGARVQPHDVIGVMASGFITQLSDDVYFDATEGRLERLAPTRRSGLSLFVDLSPLEWLKASIAGTYVRAILLESRPASVDDPDPVFEKGEAIPYVPPLVVRAEIAASHRLFRIKGFDVEGRAAVGYQALGARPLPFGERGDPVHLLDATLGFEVGVLRVGVEGMNLLGREWAAEELVYASNFNPSMTPSRLPARHIHAGMPRTLLFTLGLSL